MMIRLPSEGELILASKSPRRRELLAEMGLTFTILTRETDESYSEELTPREAARFLSEKKARAVAEIAPKDAIILASDTIVDVGGVALGKPENAEDAKRMLRALSGRAHYVHSGVCVMQNGRVLSDVDSTAVHFHPLTEEQIDWYVGTGEPMDKAGAYGIQGLGGRLISHFEGEMDTVIGLPCKMVAGLLEELSK